MSEDIMDGAKGVPLWDLLPEQISKVWYDREKEFKAALDRKDKDIQKGMGVVSMGSVTYEEKEALLRQVVGALKRAKDWICGHRKVGHTQMMRDLDKLLSLPALKLYLEGKE